MPQRQTAGGVTIAFLGTGGMDVDAATDLIEEYIEANITSDDDPVRFVFPVTSDEFSDTMGDLVNMAKQSDITYEVITSTSDKGRRSFTEIANDAAKTYHVADVFTQMEQILTEAPRALLEVLWDSEREEELNEIVGRFVDAGLDVRDLTDGNVHMDNEDEGNGAVEAESTEEPAEAEPEAEAVTVGEDSNEKLPIYARSDLEKMSRSDVKDIALKLNLPPRKSAAAMIEEIMEAQGEPEEPEETTEEEGTSVAEQAETAVVAEVVAATFGSVPDFSAPDRLVDILEALPQRLHDVFDDAITSLAKTIEGLVFNTTPEQPMAVETEAEPEPTAPRPRRLVRGR